MYRRVLVSSEKRRLVRQLSFLSLPEPFMYHDGRTGKVGREVKERSSDRPLALVLGWSNASMRSLSKYAELYHQEGGCDSILLASKPRMIYNPDHGRKVMKDLSTVCAGTDRDLIISGFSVGAFLYSNMLMSIRSDPDLQKSIEPRIRGLILDSPVDWHGVPSGLSRSVAGAEGNLLQRSLELSIHAYLALFKSIADRYAHVSDFLHKHDLDIPSLWLYSDTDLVTKPNDIHNVIDKWQARGHSVSQLEFQGSPHVLHYRHFPKKYTAALNTFFLQLQHLQKEQHTSPSSVLATSPNDIPFTVGKQQQQHSSSL